MHKWQQVFMFWVCFWDSHVWQQILHAIPLLDASILQLGSCVYFLVLDQEPCEDCRLHDTYQMEMDIWVCISYYSAFPRYAPTWQNVNWNMPFHMSCNADGHAPHHQLSGEEAYLTRGPGGHMVLGTMLDIPWAATTAHPLAGCAQHLWRLWKHSEAFRSFQHKNGKYCLQASWKLQGAILYSANLARTIS